MAALHLSSVSQVSIILPGWCEVSTLGFSLLLCPSRCCQTSLVWVLSSGVVTLGFPQPP